MSIDSWRASSMNAQVLTTTRSALAGVVGGHQPVGEERADQLVASRPGSSGSRASRCRSAAARLASLPAGAAGLPGRPGRSGRVGQRETRAGPRSSTPACRCADAVMNAVVQVAGRRSRCWSSWVARRHVLDDLAVRRDHRDPTVDQRADADVAVAVDGQRVEQLDSRAGRPGRRSGRTAPPAPARPAPVDRSAGRPGRCGSRPSTACHRRATGRCRWARRPGTRPR